MKCEEVMELMQRHLDGDLNHEEQKQLTDHLGSCPECALMMERLKQIDEDLASLPKVVPAFSIVDSILPRLEQIDASLAGSGADDSPAARSASTVSEMRLAQEDRGTGTNGRTKRPWYASPRFAGIGGLAAAAAVLGVLIINGLPDSFDRVSSSSQEVASTASGSAPAEKFMAMDSAAQANTASEAPAEPRAKQESMAAPEAPKSESPNETPKSGKAAPAPDLPLPEENHGSEPEVNVAEAAPNAPLAAEEETAEPAESADRGEKEIAGGGPGTDGEAAGTLDQRGTVYGIAGGAVEEEPDTKDGKKEISGPSAMPALMSEDGVYAAMVERLQDGTLAVKVNRMEDEKIAYASANHFPDSTKVELLSWSGATVTYAVTTEQGKRTFTIDAAAATETEVQAK